MKARPTTVAMPRKLHWLTMLVALVVGCQSPPVPAPATETPTATPAIPKQTETLQPAASRTPEKETLTPTSGVVAATESPSQTSTAQANPGEVGHYPRRLAAWGQFQVWDVDWSPDSSAVVLASDRGIHVLDLQTLQETWFAGSSAYGAAYNPDGSTIVSSYEHIPPTLWDPLTRQRVADFTVENCIGGRLVAYSPDGRSIATVFSPPVRAGMQSESSIFLWDAQAHRCVGELATVDGWMTSLAYGGPEGRSLVMALGRRNGEPQIQIWDPDSRKQSCAVPGSIAGLSADGALLAAAGPEQGIEVSLWDLADCHLLQQVQVESRPSSLAISPDRRLLATGAEKIRIWDLASGELLWEIAHLPNFVDKLAFSPDGRYLLSISPRTSPDDLATLILWEMHP